MEIFEKTVFAEGKKYSLIKYLSKNILSQNIFSRGKYSSKNIFSKGKY